MVKVYQLFQPASEGKEKRPLLAPKQEPPSTPTLRPSPNALFSSEIELSTDTEDSASESNNHESGKDKPSWLKKLELVN